MSRLVVRSSKRLLGNKLCPSFGWLVLVFIRGGIRRRAGQKDLAKAFNFTFRYIDDVLSLNNKKFIDYVHLIYPSELEIKDTTDSSTSVAYLYIFLRRNQQGQLFTKLYDKRDEFNIPVVNVPFMEINIPASPTYGVYMSQLIRYSRACSQYRDVGYWQKNS